MTKKLNNPAVLRCSVKKTKDENHLPGPENHKKKEDKSCDLSCLVAGRGLEPLTSGL